VTDVQRDAERVRGIIAALPTPMDASGAVDLDGTARVVDWLATRGIDGVFVCGTTGEGPLLTEHERVAVVGAAVQAAQGRLAVVAHVGAATTAGTVALARRCAGAGADALAVVTPYYFRLDAEALAAHFRAVAESVPDRPVFAYSIPALAGNAVTPDVLRALHPVRNLVGMKDSSGDAYGLIRLADAAPGHFRLVVGADLLALQALAMAWAGLVSGPASALPEPYVDLWRAAAAGRWPAVADAYRRVAAVCRLMHNGEIPLIKAALATRGLISPHVRPPLRPATAATIEGLRDALTATGLLRAS
jgi:4-hydroxy-tetrahydrodipicolinate synthase